MDDFHVQLDGRILSHRAALLCLIASVPSRDHGSSYSEGLGVRSGGLWECCRKRRHKPLYLAASSQIPQILVVRIKRIYARLRYLDKLGDEYQLWVEDTCTKKTGEMLRSMRGKARTVAGIGVVVSDVKKHLDEYRRRIDNEAAREELQRTT